MRGPHIYLHPSYVLQGPTLCVGPAFGCSLFVLQEDEEDEVAAWGVDPTQGLLQWPWGGPSLRLVRGKRQSHHSCCRGPTRTRWTREGVSSAFLRACTAVRQARGLAAAVALPLPCAHAKRCRQAPCLENDSDDWNNNATAEEAKSQSQRTAPRIRKQN